MNVVRRYRNDSLIVALAAVIFAATLFSLYLDRNRRLDIGDEPGGRVLYSSGQTHRQHAGRNLWEGLSGGDSVYHHNFIRTESDSEAVLALGEETRVALAPESMVLLNLQGEEPELELRAGELSLQGPVRGEGWLLVRRGELGLRASGDLSVRAMPDGGLALQAGPGPARIQAGDGTVDLERGQSARMDGRCRIDFSDRIWYLNPANGARIACEQEQARVRLAWRGPAPDSGQRRLELAADAAFEDPRIYDVAAVGELDIDLPPGSYFWRLAGPEQAAFAPARFRVVVPEHIRLFSPVHGQTIQSTSVEATIRFVWSDGPSPFYVLEIYNDPEMQRRVALVLADRAHISRTLPSGSYYWRVRPRDEQALPGMESALSRFDVYAGRVQTADLGAGLSFDESERVLIAATTEQAHPAQGVRAAIQTGEARPAVAQLPTPAPESSSRVTEDTRPQLLFPTSGSTVDMSARESLVLRWQGQGAGPYYVQLFGPANERIAAETVNAMAFEIRDLRRLDEGRFHWMVSDLSAGAEAVARGSFEIVLSAELARPEIVSQ